MHIYRNHLALNITIKQASSLHILICNSSAIKSACSDFPSTLSLSPRPIFIFVEKHPHLVFDYNVVWAVCEAEETGNHKQHCRSAIRIVSVQIMGHTYTHTHTISVKPLSIYMYKQNAEAQSKINKPLKNYQIVRKTL